MGFLPFSYDSICMQSRFAGEEQVRQVAGGKEEDSNQDVHTAEVAVYRHLAA